MKNRPGYIMLFCLAGMSVTFLSGCASTPASQPEAVSATPATPSPSPADSKEMKSPGAPSTSP